MEYTNKEKEFLDLTKRTDFKNLSKNDVISYASKLSEMRPEVATQVLEQYPEVVKLIHTTITEYKEILAEVIASDDKSLDNFYSVADRELQNIDNNREQFYDYAGKVYADLSKCLDNPNLAYEQQNEIIEQEMEILRMITQRDNEMLEKEMDIVDKIDEKDTQKRKFNWKIIGTASSVVIMAVGIGSSVLGGKFDFKLPKK